MKIEELLEYKIYTIDKFVSNGKISFKVIENPNKIQLLNLLYKKNQYNQVRGLVVNDDIYIWIAYNATHYTVIRFLREQGINGNFVLFLLEVTEDEPNFDMKLFIYGNDSLPPSLGFERMTRDLKIKEWK